MKNFKKRGCTYKSGYQEIQINIKNLTLEDTGFYYCWNDHLHHDSIWVIGPFDSLKNTRKIIYHPRCRKALVSPFNLSKFQKNILQPTFPKMSPMSTSNLKL